MNLRLKFSRFGPVKYLGHLDMMRYFQKVLLRAEIDMKYSEGFNPHQIMSFAYPLGVSMETEGDYMDIEVNSFDSLDGIVDSMNAVMNEGVKIISASIVPDNELNAMASVAAARYRIYINKSIDADRLNTFMSLDDIVITKEGKKGPVTKSIKEGIFSFEIIDNNTAELFLQSGSSLNVKPIDVIDSFNSYMNDSIVIEGIVRIDIYRVNEAEEYVPLGVF